MIRSNIDYNKEIDDLIDEWYESVYNLSLHDYLKMTYDEYTNWVSDPDEIPDSTITFINLRLGYADECF